MVLNKHQTDGEGLRDAILQPLKPAPLLSVSKSKEVDRMIYMCLFSIWWKGMRSTCPWSKAPCWIAHVF